MLKRTCLWIWASIFRTRDPMTGRYGGTIRGCPDQPVRYDEGRLGSGSFEEIWRGVDKDGRCVVCDKRGVVLGG